MLDFHRRDITADLDTAEDALEHDRDVVVTEKAYDDERQQQAVAIMSQSMNSIALVTSQTVTLAVYTAQDFVYYLFIFCATLFFTNIAKNTLYVYKKTVTKRLGINVYNLIFQYLSITGLFFFYLLFTLVRAYFTIDQSFIPFIIAAFGLYQLHLIVWNNETQTRRIR